MDDKMYAKQSVYCYSKHQAIIAAKTILNTTTKIHKIEKSTW